MPRNGTGRYLPLYDVTRTKVIRQVRSEELNQMAARGVIGWFQKKGRSYPCVQPLPMQSRTSEPLFSKVSLVMTDSELNAEGQLDGTRKYGFNRYGQVDKDIVGNRIDQSMSKVEVWPAVYDAKNVTVCAGQVHGVREVSREQLAAL